MSHNSVNFQDWTPVTIGNKKKGSAYTPPRNPKPPSLETDDDMQPKIQKFPHELIKNLVQARNAKGLTQDALAKLLIVNISIIQNLEGNKYDYNDNHKRLYVTVMKKLGVNIRIGDLPK